MEQKAMASILKWNFIDLPYQQHKLHCKNIEMLKKTRLDIKGADSLFIWNENNTTKKKKLNAKKCEAKSKGRLQ